MKCFSWKTHIFLLAVGHQKTSANRRPKRCSTVMSRVYPSTPTEIIEEESTLKNILLLFKEDKSQHLLQRLVLTKLFLFEYKSLGEI